MSSHVLFTSSRPPFSFCPTSCHLLGSTRFGVFWIPVLCTPRPQAIASSLAPPSVSLPPPCLLLYPVYRDRVLVPHGFGGKQLVQTAGVAPESIKFGTCSLQSDKYICVCQGGELVIVDMTAGNAVKRWPISAEAAIMNPTQKIVALRGEKTKESVTSLEY